MHITYEIKKRLKSEIFAPHENDRTALRFVRKRIKDLIFEKQTIIEVCGRLSRYLRKNSLSAFNDTIFEYLEHFIREEEVKRQQGASNETVIAGLKQSLEDYRQMRDFVDKGNRNEASEPPADYWMRPSDVERLVKRLYELPLNGQKIRQQVELIEKSRKTSFESQESVFFKSKYASSSLKTVLSHMLNIDTSNNGVMDDPYSF